MTKHYSTLGVGLRKKEKGWRPTWDGEEEKKLPFPEKNSTAKLTEIY